jgi:putative Ca2+/H+ antiporter (TMEM165/GDT1 family)
VHPYVALVCFPVIFVGELPDKTMFATLLMATKAKPHHVWFGAAGAFVIHVAMATTVGVALFAVLPHRVVDAIVAALFLGGAVYAWREQAKDEVDLTAREATRHGVVLTSFIVIFLAEWGDLTQILTANLAAKYHSPLSVGVGSVLALWAVAAVAVAGGNSLMRFVNVATVRKVTAAALVGLALYTGWSAIR